MFSAYAYVACLEDVLLSDLLSSRDPAVDPDVRRRAHVLLDRCQFWDETDPGECETVREDVRIADTTLTAYSIGFALTMALRGLACLVVPSSPRKGFHEVSSSDGSSSLFFFAEPRTHANRRAMRERDVEYDGRVYRCEWHAKLEGRRNRIHLTIPGEGPDGRVLVGIFAFHLTTQRARR